VNLLVALLAVTTSTAGGGLFSSEEIPDKPGGGLFSNEEIPDASPSSSSSMFSPVADAPVFTPKVRSTIELHGQGAADTAFDHPDENVLEFRWGGKLVMDVDISSSLSAYVAPKFEHVTAWTEDLDDRGFLFLNVPEAYVTWGEGRTYLRVGTQVFNWGTSDFAAPADVLNPVDLRSGMMGSLDPSSIKIPVLAAELVSGFGPLTIRGVVQPFFTPSRFFLSGWDDSLGSLAGASGAGPALPDLGVLLGDATADHIGNQLLLTKRPEDRPDNASFAARATLQFDAADISLTAVHGWESFPRIKMDPSLQKVGAILIDSFANKEPIDPLDAVDEFEALNTALEMDKELISGSYERRTLIGMDASIAADPFILKLDIAYTFERTLYTQDFRPVARPWINAAVGLEYFMGDELQILAEVFALTVLDIRSNERIQLIEPVSAAPSVLDISGKERTVAMPGAIVAVRYNMLDGDLNFDVVAVSTLTRGDWFFMPSANYKLSDNQKISIGGLIIEGKEGGYAGLFGHNDRVHLGYTWSH